MKKYHYVYKITNLNPSDERKYYIGVRTSKVKPSMDENYKSSSKYLKAAFKEMGHQNFRKEILSEWETRKLANKEEVRLHELYDVSKNIEYYNKAKSKDNGFCTEGFVTVVDLRDGKTKNVSQDEFNAYDFYVHITHGKVTVLDIETGETKNITKKEFNTRNDKFVSIAKNTVCVLDERDGTVKRVTIEEFKKNVFFQSIMKNTIIVEDSQTGEKKRISLSEYNNNKNMYRFVLKNSITVIDITNNKTKRVSIEDYYGNNNYKNTKSNIVYVYDSMDELKYTLIGNIYEESKKYNLPTRSLITSYNRNGEKMYRQITNISNPRFKFKGWYAIKKPLIDCVHN